MNIFATVEQVQPRSTPVSPTHRRQAGRPPWTSQL